MSQKSTASKDFKCKYCEFTIREGSQYKRRTEHNGIHYVTNKYHIECEQALIREQLEKKE